MNRPALFSSVAVVLAIGVGIAAAFATGAIGNGWLPTPSVVAGVGASDPVDVVTATPTPTVVPPAVAESPSASSTPSSTASSIPEVTSSDDVAAVQQVLTELRYYVGPIDGKAGPATASAVQAFQKVHDLSADGVIGPNTIAALSSPRIPTLRGGPATRAEVDLDTQVMYFVEDGALSRILPISSGSGESYSNPGGGTARSVTPVGNFTIERHISGVRNAPLGTLYDPMYFYGGWAIHGSNSVPAYPASHGCVRVTRADALWLFDRLPIGTTVSIYGNTNAFSPELGESAGTNTPAGDTVETTPDDGIQTEEPTPPVEPISPAPAPAPPPPAPSPPAPSPTPSPTPDPPAATTPPPSTEPTTSPSTPPPTDDDPPPSDPSPADPTPSTSPPEPPERVDLDLPAGEDSG